MSRPVRLSRSARSVAGLAATAAALAVASPASASTTYSVTHAVDYYSGHSVVVRWSPCQRAANGTVTTHVISYRVNAAGVPSRVTFVQQALARLTAASGLRFRYLGTTSYVPHDAVLHYPSGNRLVFDAAQERAATGAELVVAWAYRSQTNLLNGGEAGSGTASWSTSTSSQLRIVEGAVLVRRGVSLRSGFVAGASWGNLILHELGHAVGLNHVTSTAQLMYPTLGRWTRAGYQSGDVAGLHAVGRPAGCFTTPPAPPVNPAQMARAAGVPVSG